MSEIEIERTAEVAVITLNRPDALNAITPTMLESLADATEELAADREIRVVILTGAGRAFSAGVDLKSLGGRSLDGGMVGDVLDLPARRATTALSTMPAITIAKVNGFCFTGALELALACDLIVVADEAKLADTHTKWGLRPTWGMSQRLPALVGIARARELSYTARTFTGTEARAMGLAARSAPHAALDTAVHALVEELLANSAQALAAYKALYGARLDLGLDAGLAHEASTHFAIDDPSERLGAFGR